MGCLLRKKEIFGMHTKLKNSKIFFNRRMPNCNTVVQTASDLFELEIGLNSLKKWHFSALYQTKQAPKILRHCSVKTNVARNKSRD